MPKANLLTKDGLGEITPSRRTGQRGGNGENLVNLVNLVIRDWMGLAELELLLVDL